jgi:primosomal protein N' (replication factor Y)
VCRSTELEEDGRGTERIEDQLAALFPGVGLSRMDADTTAVRGSHAAILDAFREGRTQLLVGTQIVAKGHDFPGVHTAVVVSVGPGLPDAGLPRLGADLRRCWCSSPAGRAAATCAGRVLVQTWKPDHYALSDLGDVEGFLDREMRLRRTLRYPPVTRLVLVRIDGVDRAEVQAAARGLSGELRANLPRGVDVLGPAMAALPRLVGRWRYQLVLRGDDPRVFRGWLEERRSLLERAARRGVRVVVDVDPRQIM